MVCDLSYLDRTSSNGNSVMEDAKDLRISHSSELMENYLQAEALPPTGHFEVLQSENENGHALVFTINSQGLCRDPNTELAVKKFDTAQAHFTHINLSLRE
ncbi:hypothetical protein ETB97_004753 [Aspergillus alliaceus]|uniref:Uncharacterized protein n=1 Tax=Petromyces alliaceus TaxID=209559 RepID=A0A8H6E3L9_PETAA|nr:hypothetical protein ETB97_004753 [Aspergillus burnettii]